MTAVLPVARSLHGAPQLFDGGLAEVAPRTFAWLQPNGDWGESNAGLIVAEDQVALIDTTWDLATTRRLLRDVRTHTDLPIEHLLLTHADGDHVYGAQLVPDSPILCSEETAAELHHEDPAGLARSLAGARLLSRVGVGAPRRFGRYIDWMLGAYDFRGITVRSADQTFAGSISLLMGDRGLTLEHLGPAHTAGDTIVHLPDVRTVFAGDLLFVGVTPNTWAGTIDGWRKALDRIGQLGPRVVVPGHGPVADLAAVETLDRYWAWLQEHATPLLRDGKSASDTAFQLITSDAFASEPWGSWICPERTVANVINIDRARRGGSPAIEPKERARVLWQIAGLAHRLRRAAR